MSNDFLNNANWSTGGFENMLNIFAICNIAIVSASAANVLSSHIGRLTVGAPKIRRMEDLVKNDR